MKVSVFAAGALIYHTHRDDAARLVRDGLAERTNRARIDLAERAPDKNAPPRFGNPQKYTFSEPVGEPVIGHCQSLKLHVANPRNWPIFRAALVDCLPRDKQAQIRELFAPKKDRRAA